MPTWSWVGAGLLRDRSISGPENLRETGADYAPKLLYSAHGDYLFNFDGQTLLGAEGLFLKVRAEHRMGQQIGGSLHHKFRPHPGPFAYGLVVNPANCTTFPYSTLGAGFLLLGEDPQETFFWVSVLNATDTTRTVGFDELFERGVAI